MDATTKQKSLAGFLATLLLASVFVTVVPTANASHASGGSVADAFIDVGIFTSATFAGEGPLVVATITTPTVGIIRYNTTYDATFTNIPTSGGPTGYGYGNAAGTTGFKLERPNGVSLTNARDASADLAHAGRFNVTFPSTIFDQTGFWRLKDSTNNSVAIFLVSPLNELTVSLSQSVFTYSESNVVFTITVAPLATGQTASLQGTGIPGGTTVSGPAGQYVFTGPMPEAGTHTIFANRSIDGDVKPEITGNTTFTVVAAALAVTNIDVTPKSGFSTTGTWNVTYPGNLGAVFRQTSGVLGRTFVNSNLSITGTNGFNGFVNLTPSGAGTCQTNFAQTLNNSLRNATKGCTITDAAGALVNGVAMTSDFGTRLFFDAGGNLTFRPNATWPAGTYTFSLSVNSAGVGTSAQEYATTWQFTPATPANVNLEVRSGGTQITNLTVQPAAMTDNSTGAPRVAGGYTLAITVVGNIETEHPSDDALTTPIGSLAITSPNTRGVADAFAAANVSISGDVVLTGLFSYAEGPGIATITGVIPTKSGGNVNVAVTWKGTTTTVTFPIVDGAVLTSSTTELIVDLSTSVSFTVKDEFGNTVPDAKVFLFKKFGGAADTDLAGVTAINGTGAPGAGQNGVYTATVKPTVIGKYLAYAIIGRVEGSTDHRNYSYFEFAVVPAHDVNVTITPTQTMGALQTMYTINATIADGRALGTSAQIYFLTAKQRSDFLVNLTLEASGQSTGAPASQAYTTVANSAGGITNYFVNVTLTAGDYHVYICGDAASSTAITGRCSSARHDNNQSLPLVNVTRYRATFTPAQIADNPLIQANTTVNITVTDRSNAPVNGTIRLNTVFSKGAFGFTNATGGVTPTSVSVVNGFASLTLTGVTSGDIVWDFDPEGAPSGTWDILEESFEIVGPNVVVTPPRIPVGQTTTVTMVVKTLDGKALQGRNIRICGIPIGGSENPGTTLPAGITGCTGNATTNVDGIATLGVFPSTTGTMLLYLNETRTATTIIVYAGLQVTYTPTAPVAGDTVTVLASQVGKTTGETGVTLNVSKNGTVVSGFPQTTGANGIVVLSNVVEGVYLVTATKPGFDTAFENITVGPKATTNTTTGAKFELSNLVAPTAGTVGQSMSVSADLRNTGSAAGTANVLLLVNGAVRDTRAIPVAAGGKETLTFDFAPTAAGTFTVTVKLATGETLAERTVTISPVASTTTTTTTTTGQTTTTTSTTTTTTTPTPTPRVPGFEVVALLGALAVALLVLRRRN